MNLTRTLKRLFIQYLTFRLCANMFAIHFSSIWYIFYSFNYLSLIFVFQPCLSCCLSVTMSQAQLMELTACSAFITTLQTRVSIVYCQSICQGHNLHHFVINECFCEPIILINLFQEVNLLNVKFITCRQNHCTCGVIWMSSQSCFACCEWETGCQ